MVRAKRQFQICICLAILNLATGRRLARVPSNAVAARVRGCDFQGSTSKTIAEDVAHVVPDLIDVEIVCEDKLADVRFEDTVLDIGDLERDAAGCWIAVENLTVGSVFGNRLLGANATTDRPEVDGFVALVGHNRAANGLHTSDERDESDGVKEHNECL